MIKPHETGGSQVHHLNRSTKPSATPLELHRGKPNGVTPQIDFCQFVSKLLQLKHFPWQQADYIAKNAWWEGMVKYWENYTTEAKKGFYDLTFELSWGFWILCA